MVFMQIPNHNHTTSYFKLINKNIIILKNCSIALESVLPQAELKHTLK